MPAAPTSGAGAMSGGRRTATSPAVITPASASDVQGLAATTMVGPMRGASSGL